MEHTTSRSAFRGVHMTLKHMRLFVKWFCTAIAFLVPILVFYLTESITHDIQKYMNENAQILNIILYEAIFLLLFGIIGSLRVALIFETLFFTIFGLANYYVISFRSTPIQPWDFLSIKTASSVAGNFTYHLPDEVIWKLVAILVLILFVSRIKFKLPIKKHYTARAVITSSSLLLLASFTMNIHNESYIAKMKLYDKLFTPTTIFYRDGGALAFLMELKYMSVEVPEHYSAKSARNLLASQGIEEEDSSLYPASSGKKYPNIIVIMNEAFSDLSVLGDLDTNEDYMPYIHSLSNSNQASTGYLNVSVVGGNTANSEFEFLTGNTMAFLPAGSVAYQQYITDTIDSLPYHMNRLGYRTVAMHPYPATGWNRNQVYEYMTFDETYFLEDFKGDTKVRNYISDSACVSKIIRSYETLQKENSDEPLFLFLVTMQNHSSYTKEYSNFTPNITIDGTDSFVLSSYLSLLQKSDRAFERLTDYFSNVEDDTMIVFFGDHQPADSVANIVYQLNRIDKSTLSEEELSLRYKVPFIIWTNYETEVEHNIETSANYLGVRMLETAGLPLPDYWNFLKEMQKTIPVLSAQTVIDASGNRTSVKKQSEALHDYQVLQYYQLFDAKTETLY